MALPQPTKCRLRSMVLADCSMEQHCNQLKVYETITKPYITAQMTIIDNMNLIDNLELVGGEPCTFSFDAGEGRVYEQTLHVLNIKGNKSNQSLRAMIYQIDLIGPEYFADKKELVQQSFKNIPGTAAIQKLHSQYIGGALRILASSLGPISLQSYIVSAKNPFTAVNDIRKRLTYGKYQTGNTLYFRDRDGHVLGPLEALFDELSPQQTFFQEATWGKNWFDAVRAQNAIIAATAEVDNNAGGGRAGMAGMASAAQQSKTTFDARTKEVKKILSKKIEPGKVVGAALSLASPILGGKTSHGGLVNYLLADTAHLPLATDKSSKTERENLYSAVVKGGPRMLIKVPINSGINCTVGKGAFLKLLPPVGDLNTGVNRASGLYLITDLCHDLAFDDRMMNGLTTFNCVRGGVGD